MDTVDGAIGANLSARWGCVGATAKSTNSPARARVDAALIKVAWKTWILETVSRDIYNGFSVDKPVIVLYRNDFVL